MGYKDANHNLSMSYAFVFIKSEACPWFENALRREELTELDKCLLIDSWHKRRGERSYVYLQSDRFATTSPRELCIPNEPNGLIMCKNYYLNSLKLDKTLSFYRPYL